MEHLNIVIEALRNGTLTPMYLNLNTVIVLNNTVLVDDLSGQAIQVIKYFNDKTIAEHDIHLFTNGVFLIAMFKTEGLKEAFGLLILKERMIICLIGIEDDTAQEIQFGSPDVHRDWNYENWDRVKTRFVDRNPIAMLNDLIIDEESEITINIKSESERSISVGTSSEIIISRNIVSTVNIDGAGGNNSERGLRLSFLFEGRFVCDWIILF